MIKELKENYKTMNILILGFCIFIFMYPIISKILEIISPKLTLCIFLSITGKPCPLCGGTRFVAGLPYAIVSGDFNYMLNFFGIFIITVIVEFLFRITNLFKKNYSEKLKDMDIMVHIILGIVILLYEISYIIYI